MISYKAPIVVILIFVLQSVIHYFIADQLQLAPETFFSIYAFLFIITLFTILLIEFSNIVFKEQLGFIFIAIILFKLVAALLFIQMADMNKAPEKYHFIIAYLILIIILTMYTAEKLLKDDKKSS